MFQWMSKKMNQKRKGFTLIELVVVIAILGILAAIAIPRLTTSRKTAAIAAHQANTRTLQSSASMFLAEAGVPSADIVWTVDDKVSVADDPATADVNEAKPGWENYLQEWPKTPTGTGDSDVDGKPYVVTIKTDSSIIVAPPAVDN